MTKTFFIVTYSESEPELFDNHQEAFDFMEEELDWYGVHHSFPRSKIDEAIQKMTKMYNKGKSKFFKGELKGYCELCCYSREMEI